MNFYCWLNRGRQQQQRSSAERTEAPRSRKSVLANIGLPEFRAVLVVLQANPHFGAKTRPTTDWFSKAFDTLEEKSLAFTGQVVLVHGDSHYFRTSALMSQCFKEALQREQQPRELTRVETFGPADVHWVLGKADPKNRWPYCLSSGLCRKT